MIAIFGASVTQQKTGYAMRLKSMFKEDVRIFAYGGMHLNNAGICFIDEVVKTKPSYCLVDWFSTEYMNTDNKTKLYIDTIINKFSKINCKLIFLFLQSKRNSVEFYNFCKKYLDENDINLDVIIKDYDNLLRDDIHTTSYGAERYAEIIYNYIINNNIIIASKKNRPYMKKLNI